MTTPLESAAHPCHDECAREVEQSMATTLRDFFAAAALTGYCANPEYEDSFYSTAVNAYRNADEMLKVRGER